MAFQVKFQHQRFYISCAILLLSAVLIQPNMHLVEEEYVPCAWKFTINPDTFINFVVEGKAMRPESLSHNTYEKRSWTDINAKCKTEHLKVTWCALCFYIGGKQLVYVSTEIQIRDIFFWLPNIGTKNVSTWKYHHSLNGKFPNFDHKRLFTFFSGGIIQSCFLKQLIWLFVYAILHSQKCSSS